MHFIIPKNYQFKPKLFGLLDYQTAVLDIICAGFLSGIVNLFSWAISIKIYIFIGLFIPFLLFSVIGVHNENIASVLIYVLKYYKNQKLYLFKKENVSFTNFK